MCREHGPIATVQRGSRRLSTDVGKGGLPEAAGTTGAATPVIGPEIVEAVDTQRSGAAKPARALLARVTEEGAASPGETVAEIALQAAGITPARAPMRKTTSVIETRLGHSMNRSQLIALLKSQQGLNKRYATNNMWEGRRLSTFNLCSALGIRVNAPLEELFHDRATGLAQENARREIYETIQAECQKILPAEEIDKYIPAFMKKKVK